MIIFSPSFNHSLTICIIDAERSFWHFNFTFNWILYWDKNAIHIIAWCISIDDWRCGFTISFSCLCEPHVEFSHLKGLKKVHWNGWPPPVTKEMISKNDGILSDKNFAYGTATEECYFWNIKFVSNNYFKKFNFIYLVITCLVGGRSIKAWQF